MAGRRRDQDRSSDRSILLDEWPPQLGWHVSVLHGLQPLGRPRRQHLGALLFVQQREDLVDAAPDMGEKDQLLGLPIRNEVVERIRVTEGGVGSQYGRRRAGLG